MNNNEKRVVIYARESRDENGANYETIETQRDMLIKFCHRKGYYNIVDSILDDDISGTSFERFGYLKEKIRSGNIDIVVFKDSSRLGRNQLESLLFVDFLQQYGVELLFESEEYNEDIFPLFAWFNEQRAKEDSRKIRHVLRHKMEEGQLITSLTYGYTKKDKMLVIEEEQAKVVREIYSLFLSGKGTYEIATHLNYANIPTPSQAQCLQRTAASWNRQHVWRILTNDIYTGRMTYGKKEKVSFKSKKIVNKNRDEWIIMENHHKAIISADDFEKVQEKRKKISRRAKNYSHPHLISGIMKCGRCGSNLVLRQRKGRRIAYICVKNHKEGSIKDHIRPNYGCSTHFVAEDEMIGYITEYVLSLIESSCDSSVYINQISNLKKSNDAKEEQKKSLESEISKLERMIEQIYDDKLNGIITQALFVKKTEQYTGKIEEHKKKLTEVINFLMNSKNPKVTQKTIEQLKEEIAKSGITRNVIISLFNKIIVFNPNEITTEVKTQYNLPDLWFEEIKGNGGYIFDEVFEGSAESRRHQERSLDFIPLYSSIINSKIPL